MDNATVVPFIRLVSAFTKRAADELNTRQQEKQAAAANVDDVVELMVTNQAIGEHQKDAARTKLASHSDTIALLKRAVEKIGDIQNDQLKSASDLGQPVDDPSAQPAIAESPYVGRRQGSNEKRGSDVAFLTKLGLN